MALCQTKQQMMKTIKQISSISVLVLFVSQASVAQAPASAPDWWSCVQRYVPELSAGVFWTGELPGSEALQDHFAIVEVARQLTDRVVPFADAVKMIEQFFESEPWKKDKSKAAGLLVSAITVAANEHRDRVMQGIKRFSTRQRMMLNRIDQQAQKIEQIDNGQEDSSMRADLEVRQKWDIRVFEEREQLSAALCEQPVFLEQRLFALGKQIQQQTTQAK